MSFKKWKTKKPSKIKKFVTLELQKTAEKEFESWKITLKFQNMHIFYYSLSISAAQGNFDYFLKKQ